MRYVRLGASLLHCAGPRRGRTRASSPQYVRSRHDYRNILSVAKSEVSLSVTQAPIQAVSAAMPRTAWRLRPRDG